jgi:hypothetical protein
VAIGREWERAGNGSNNPIGNRLQPTAPIGFAVGYDSLSQFSRE